MIGQSELDLLKIAAELDTIRLLGMLLLVAVLILGSLVINVMRSHKTEVTQDNEIIKQLLTMLGTLSASIDQLKEVLTTVSKNSSIEGLGAKNSRIEIHRKLDELAKRLNIQDNRSEKDTP